MKLVFENATIRDSITRAARIAPTRGAAFDKAAGILISVVDGQVSVRATNLEVFYHEVVDAVSVEGEGEWRLGSALLSGWVSKLSVASGAQVTFESDGTTVKATTKGGGKRSTAKFRTSRADYFPDWDVIPPEEMSNVEKFADLLRLVTWAAHTEAPLNGIRLTGDAMIATDRYRIAHVPCSIPTLKEPITVPTTIFEPLIKTLGDVEVGSAGGHLYLMPDQYTQVKAVIYGEQYPPVVEKLPALSQQPAKATLKKDVIATMIQTTNVFAGNERVPSMSIILGQEQFACMLQQDGNVGGDTVETPGNFVHRFVTINFSPRSLLEAINACPSETFDFYYDPDNPKGAVRIDGGGGYEAFIMPQTPQQVAAERAAAETAKESGE